MTTGSATGTWLDTITQLTPIQQCDGRWYKRDDLYAPLGPESINGSKLRQLIYLIGRARAQGACGVINGASVHSPQICMSAIVGRHFGLPVHVILGGTHPASARKHVSVRLAEDAGATFEYIKIGYNPALQRAVKEWHARHPDWFRLCYGITTDDTASDDEVRAFHDVGAAQTRNIPPDVERLIVPMGSANSVTSVLYGLALDPPAGLRTVTLLGIGPNRLGWLDNRLEQIERASGLEIRALFGRTYHHNQALAIQQDARVRRDLRSWRLEHYDLHTTGWTTYGERKPYTLDGITFHPNYEGKMLAYMREHGNGPFAGWWDGDGKSMLWIVGNEPKVTTV